MNEPATDVPPCATMSTSQKPGAGSFQSLNVRIGTSPELRSRSRPVGDGRPPPQTSHRRAFGQSSRRSQ